MAADWRSIDLAQEIRLIHDALHRGVVFTRCAEADCAAAAAIIQRRERGLA